MNGPLYSNRYLFKLFPVVVLCLIGAYVPLDRQIE